MFPLDTAPTLLTRINPADKQKVIFAIQVYIGTTLDCFYCNSFVGKLPCPANQTENITTWKAAYNKYITYKNGKYCKILADADGIIIEQVTATHVTLCG